MELAKIGIREAKIHLSKYLKMVQKGTEVIITDRGRPIVKIVPIKTKELPLAERLKRLEDQGLLEVASETHINKIPPPIPLADGISKRFLKEDRENG